MFQWFDNWFAKKCKQAWENYCVVEDSQPPGLTAINSTILHQRGMNFTIYQANGGYVIVYSKYDERTDKNYHALHIISNDQELGQGIAHIITYEMLKQ